MNEDQALFAKYKEHAGALLASPDDARALVNQFTLLAARGERTAAHLCLTRRAAALEPNEFYPVFNLASAQMRAGQYAECLETFERALDLAPSDRQADALHHIGLAHHDLGEFDKAVRWYDRALSLKPADKEALQSKAIAKMAKGDLAPGLFEFEVLHHTKSLKPIQNAGIPRWAGEDLTGKRLIVADEQGWGDTLQFCRFLPRLNPKTVTWVGRPQLNRLMASHFKWDGMQGEEGPFEADYYCSPISATGALGITYADVSGEPYLRADPVKLPARGRVKVGLVWRGSPGYLRDADRSFDLETYAPLLDLPGAAFYSLQVGPAAKQISKLGLDGFIGDLSCFIKDWADTASVIAALDLVVTSDTAVAHLAGALGKPTFVILNYSPCWRWMRGTDLTPWYRNTRLFRQSRPNEWSGPVMAARRALKEMLA